MALKARQWTLWLALTVNLLIIVDRGIYPVEAATSPHSRPQSSRTSDYYSRRGAHHEDDDDEEPYQAVPEYEILKIFILHGDNKETGSKREVGKTQRRVTSARPTTKAVKTLSSKTEVYALVKDNGGHNKLLAVHLLPPVEVTPTKLPTTQAAPTTLSTEPTYVSKTPYKYEPQPLKDNYYEEQEIDYHHNLRDLIENVPGIPGIDYPILDTIPHTGFSCNDQRYKGFFADTATRCQVWHYCDFTDGQSSFLCPNGTIFNQVMLTCDWWFNVDCRLAPQQYVLNERLYKYIKPLTPKFPEDFHGPLVDQYLSVKYSADQAKKARRAKAKAKQAAEQLRGSIR